MSVVCSEWFIGAWWAWFCDGCGFVTGVYSECGLQ